MEFKDNKAIYLQIADHICENILLQKWNANEKIPSVRETAVHMEVNPNTAMRTFSYLQDQGIIFNKRGIGYFVTEEGFNKTLMLKKEIFIKEELPVFFKTLELLNMTLEDIKGIYQQEYKNNSALNNRKNHEDK
ncbi:GntR family transcriptional regulator [Xanthovirga aplysinae]|uniref:GntR family transcriptional regulator n=1 Tax=Xanthovirga aplysinae TaxID=2529853 RepID=UPI0012BC8521|nr:GntR family transcriptional regulator [Xanthovirga aplysinae]MTI30537.1 GntR family transcriptional regulator [Xanthovirga aplysinae]